MDNLLPLKRITSPASRGMLSVVLLLMLFFSDVPEGETAPPEAPAIVRDAFGIEAAAYQIQEQPIRRNQTFSDILTAYHVSPPTINELVEKARPVFDLRHLRAGKSLRIYRNDSLQAPQLVVYEADPIRYVVFDLRDSLRVYEKRRTVTVRRKVASGVITRSPYQTLEAQGANPVLAVELSRVFAWQIDFYRIHQGDRFKVIYEEREVAGQSVGLGKIIAARFDHGGKTFHAFRFGEGKDGGYYDEAGNTLRRAFLKAPLEYSRISSRYTKRRFHPVLKRYRAHLGTDYAAPTGTPIRATADGVVVAAAYTKGNGRYVKIEHNKTYTTGYLHMSRFAKGMRRGRRVQQGEVIGYVGSTGLATGPHLCYRFWRRGKQVDPLKLDLPTSEPIDEARRPAFVQVRDRLLPLLQYGLPVQVTAQPGMQKTQPPAPITAP